MERIFTAKRMKFSARWTVSEHDIIKQESRSAPLLFYARRSGHIPGRRVHTLARGDGMSRKKAAEERPVRDVFPERRVTAEELRRIAGEISRLLAAADTQQKKPAGGSA